MRKLILGILVSSLPAFAATSSLEVDGDGPAIGIQAGLNFETASTPTQISSSTHTGFSGGLNVDFPIAQSFSVQPELNYVHRGLNLANAGGLTANVYYHSLELPVLAKLSIVDKFKISLLAGPMVTWNMSTQVQGTLGEATATTFFNPETFDLAAVGGVGAEIGPVFANVRYILGLVDINANSAEWKSRGFRLMVGLRI